MTFYDWIVSLRREGKIPKKWKVSEIKPFLLQEDFSSNTINVYPNNCSISPDGTGKGDYVKRGQEAKFYRFGNGEFGLISEFTADELSGYTGTIVKVEKPHIHRTTTSRSNRLNDIFNTKQIFNDYLVICNRVFREISPSLFLYRLLIDEHKNKSLEVLFNDNKFIELIYVILITWNMDSRRARLKEFNEFKNIILAAKEEINELVQYKIHKISGDAELNSVISKIKNLFIKLPIMESNAQIVGGSKLLHFLLPDLVMPIDRTYTLNCIYGHNKYDNDIEKEAETLENVFNEFYAVMTQLQLQDAAVDGEGWNTSVPKLIDNAIIGFIKSKNVEQNKSDN